MVLRRAAFRNAALVIRWRTALLVVWRRVALFVVWRRAVLLAARLHPIRHPQRRIVQVVDDPYAAERDDARQEDVGQRLHQRAEKTREGSEDRRTCGQKLHARPVERPSHRSDDQDQQDLLPYWPILPGHGHEPCDLVDGPGPDQLDEMKDRRNALMQESQELIE